MSLTNWLLLAILIVLIGDACTRFAIYRMVKAKGEVKIVQRWSMESKPNPIPQPDPDQ